MTDTELLQAEKKARLMAHNCTVYTGDQVYLATMSGQRSAACGERWQSLRTEVKKRGLSPLKLN